MSHGKIDFGVYLHELRTARNFSQKKVAEKLGIDISLLSKIEHGERQLQGHMLKALSEIFDLDYRLLQIKFLSKKLQDEFSDEPYFKDAIQDCISNLPK